MLTTNLPNSLTVSGREYPIDTDFRRWIRFGQLFEAEDLTDTEKANIALINTYGSIINSPEQAFKQAIWFYQCGKEPRGEPAKERLLDWEKDWMTIWADMRIWCRINLRRVRHLHWWEFMALFHSLPSDAAIKQAMQLRAIDLNKIKDPEMRKEYAERKQLVYLGESKATNPDPFGY